MKKLLMIMLFILLGQSSLIHGAPIMEVRNSNLEFIAKGFPSFLKIKGESKQLSGLLEEKGDQLRGKILLNLDTLSTGIDLRDEHMKKNYLETGKFKNAELVIPPFKPASEGTTKGILTLRNKKKEVDIKYTITKTEKGMKAKTSFKVNITDFEIPVPVYQGITVAKTVDLNINLEAIRK